MDSLSPGILETGNRPVRLHHSRMSDEIGSGFFHFLHGGWAERRETKTTPFLLFFCIYLSFSTPLILLLAAPGPACVSVDRDGHMQGGQQPCLASACSPWQKISMRADNRTRNENNAVCQPRNPACRSRTFAILGVFHEHSSTRKLNLKWNSAFAALIPDRPRLQRLWETSDVWMWADVHRTDPGKSCSSLASTFPTLTRVHVVFICLSGAIFLHSFVKYVVLACQKHL